MKLPESFRPPQHYKPEYQEAFGDFPDSSFGLLTMLLVLDPSYRGTAASALQSEFFSSSPLACYLSGLPVIYKEEEEPYKTKDRKKRRTSKRMQSSGKKHEDHEIKDLTTEQKKDDTDTSREFTLWVNAFLLSDKEKQKGHETSNSASNTSSSVKPIKYKENLRASLSPILCSNSKLALRTVAHPIATQNI
ncbi:hypothetical protein CRYUN_Cryun17cG0082000 [Craigia yunnanensis]